MSINITINGKTYETTAGHTIYDICDQIGINIPTLCHIKGRRNDSSCSVCLVKEIPSGRLLTSCSTLIQDGMEIITEDDEVINARKESLEILLSEHVGDCEAPCQTACPIGFDIPSIMDKNRSDEELYKVIIQTIPFPSITSRLCKAPCQNACRRGLIDKHIKIRQTIQEISDTFLHTDIIPITETHSDKTVSINVTSFALLASAWKFQISGYRVYIINNLKDENFLKDVEPNIVAAEIKKLSLLGITFSPIEDCNYQLKSSSVKDGSHIATSIKNGFLLIQDLQEKPITDRVISSMGKIRNEEREDYLSDHKTTGNDEHSKCLHCDCIGKKSCMLREYSRHLKAHQHSFRVNSRDEYQTIRDFGLLQYDVNRCILCKKCIRIAHKHNRDMTFINRGYRSEIFIPEKTNREPMDRETAILCEEICPTKALYYRGDKE